MSRAVVEGPSETVEMERAEPPDKAEKGQRVKQGSQDRSKVEESGSGAQTRRRKRRGRSFEVAAEVDAEAADRRGSSAPPADEVQQARWALGGRKIM